MSDVNEVRAKLYDFLPKVEGYDDDVYKDQRGKSTVGYGFNMDQPGASNDLEKLGLNSESLKAGKEIVSPEQAQSLMDQKLHEKEKLYDKYQQEYFPQTELPSNKKAAILSMMYNSPELLGPNMRQHLNNADDGAVIKEMLLRSNQKKSPGILKRRIMEAEMYGGEDLPVSKIIEQLSPEELADMRSVLKKMKNEHELKNITSQYPMLAHDYQKPLEQIKFNKLFKGK